MRSKLRILCLFERYDNSSQCANYADNEKGFCIEYTLLAKNLVPVLYDEKKPLNFFDLFLIMYFDKASQNKIAKREINEKIIRSILTKGKEGSNEEEWRILLTKDELKTNLCEFNFASAIYLGKSINNHNQARLVNIAKSLGIGVYKRKLDSIGSNYEVIKIV